jgi:hypothetical protein
LVALAFYISSLFLPVGDLDGILPGWHVLLIGWLHPIPWFANVFFAVGVSHLMRRDHACGRFIGTAAALLALTSWLVKGKWYLGYYLWQASFIILAVGEWAIYRMSRSVDGPKNPANAAMESRQEIDSPMAAGRA